MTCHVIAGSSLSKPGDLTVVGTSFDSDMVDDNSSMVCTIDRGGGGGQIKR